MSENKEQALHQPDPEETAGPAGEPQPPAAEGTEEPEVIAEIYDIDQVPDVEESTIFTDSPMIREKTPKDAGHRMLKRILAMVLAICILLTAVILVIRLIPTEEETDETESTATTAYVPVVSLQESHITGFSVDGPEGSWSAYPTETTVTSTDSSGTSSESTSTVWNLTGIEDVLIDHSSLAVTAGYTTSIQATRVLEDSAADLAQYGLERPALTLTVESSQEGEGYTLLFGDLAPTGDGYYACLSGSRTVYLLGTTTYENFAHPITYYGDVTMLTTVTVDEVGDDSYFTDGALSSFDTIEISGSQYESPIVIRPNPYSDGSYIPYIMTAPVQQNVQGEAGEAVLALLSSGVLSDGVYAFYPDSAVLAQYGLDQPRMVIRYTVGSYTKTVRIADAPEDGYLAVMVDDVPMIYQMSSSQWSFLHYTQSNFYNSYIFLDDITTVSAVTVTTAAGTHTYALTHGTDENETATLEVNCDGKTLASEDFRNLYQYMIQCKASEFTTEPVAADAALTLTIHYLDSARDDLRIEYAPYSDRRYEVTVNGVPLGYVYLNTVNNLIAYENGYYNGETVPSP